jgi:hypothetical protein
MSGSAEEVASYLALKKRVPLLLKVTSRTALEWPMYVCMHLPLPCTSQICNTKNRGYENFVNWLLSCISANFELVTVPIVGQLFGAPISGLKQMATFLRKFLRG